MYTNVYKKIECFVVYMMSIIRLIIIYQDTLYYNLFAIPIQKMMNQNTLTI